MELSNLQTKGVLKTFPVFPLSYEIVSHKKVVSTPGISTAIATGKKYLAWFTFQGKNNVCYLIELNKNRVPTKVFLAKTNYDWTLSTGTIVYGTIPDNSETTMPFLVENIYMFKGIPLANFQNGNYCFGSKLEFILDFMKCVSEIPIRGDNTIPQLIFHLPAMWYIDESNKDQCSSIPEHIAASISYTCHHVQYKELNRVSTFFNFNITKMKEAILVNDEKIQLKTLLASMHTPCIPDLSKPQYKLPTVFKVTADVQYDIYHLFAASTASNATGGFVYYGIASIPSYEKSVIMNRLFRNIRENENIDYIEESDTEEDFENLDCTRYVDLDKEIYMECVFHEKFRKWQPMSISSRENVVDIEKLIRKSVSQENHISTAHGGKSRGFHKGEYHSVEQNQRTFYPQKSNNRNKYTTNSANGPAPHAFSSTPSSDFRRNQTFPRNNTKGRFHNKVERNCTDRKQ